MSNCGIIVEYNPFHNGHKFHIKQSRELAGADGIIAVMSGSFVQRGQPAIFDKFTRAKAAIAGGADLLSNSPFVTPVPLRNFLPKVPFGYLPTQEL